jgi:hypothetical protein
MEVLLPGMSGEITIGKDTKLKVIYPKFITIGDIQVEVVK